MFRTLLLASMVSLVTLPGAYAMDERSMETPPPLIRPIAVRPGDLPARNRLEITSHERPELGFFFNRFISNQDNYDAVVGKQRHLIMPDDDINTVWRRLKILSIFPNKTLLFLFRNAETFFPVDSINNEAKFASNYDEYFRLLALCTPKELEEFNEKKYELEKDLSLPSSQHLKEMIMYRNFTLFRILRTLPLLNE